MPCVQIDERYFSRGEGLRPAKRAHGGFEQWPEQVIQHVLYVATMFVFSIAVTRIGADRHHTLRELFDT